MRTNLALLALLVFQSMCAAEDWPQWLGPRRDGSSTENVAAWKGKLTILWKQPVYEGHSSPVVAKGRVYLHTKVKDRNEEDLTAFDAESGKPIWSKSFDRDAFVTLFGNGPRATPAVVGGKVYTFGITGVLTCFDADKGERLWHVNTLNDFKAANLRFGVSCSPLIVGDRVLINVGGKGASIVAFDRNSGKTLWQTLDDSASYASGALVDVAGKKQAIFLTSKGLVSLAPEDGKVYWKHPLVDALAESSTTPVLAGDILFGSSVTFGGLALKIAKTPDGPTATEIWKSPDLNCYFSTPVAVGKHLFVVTSTKPLTALKISSTLRCIDLETGKEKWNRPNVGQYHASLLRTGDNKLLLLEEAGQLVLLDADPKQYRELARSPICGNTWAHPALANGKLYVRDGKHLVCVQMSQ